MPRLKVIRVAIDAELDLLADLVVNGYRSFLDAVGINCRHLQQELVGEVNEAKDSISDFCNCCQCECESIAQPLITP
jgi:hypothetical protein